MTSQDSRQVGCPGAGCYGPACAQRVWPQSLIQIPVSSLLGCSLKQNKIQSGGDWYENLLGCIKVINQDPRRTFPTNTAVSTCSLVQSKNICYSIYSTFMYFDNLDVYFEKALAKYLQYLCLDKKHAASYMVLVWFLPGHSPLHRCLTSDHLLAFWKANSKISYSYDLPKCFRSLSYCKKKVIEIENIFYASNIVEVTLSL